MTLVYLRVPRRAKKRSREIRFQLLRTPWVTRVTDQAFVHSIVNFLRGGFSMLRADRVKKNTWSAHIVRAKINRQSSDIAVHLRTGLPKF